ncbi:MAG: GNAT family N-acetyltransferase [Pyrinomonadaceae bacterium]
MIIAETDRLILRRLEHSDAGELFRIYSGPEMLKYLGGGPLTPASVLDSLFNHIRESYDVHGFGLWGVVLKETGALIGRSGILYSEINGKRGPELAYLTDSAYWGKGFASEAARAVMNVAVEEFAFSRIVAVIHPDNDASIRVIEKLGFDLETMISSYKDFGSVLLYSRQLRVELEN